MLGIGLSCSPACLISLMTATNRVHARLVEKSFESSSGLFDRRSYLPPGESNRCQLGDRAMFASEAARKLHSPSGSLIDLLLR